MTAPRKQQVDMDPEAPATTEHEWAQKLARLLWRGRGEIPTTRAEWNAHCIRQFKRTMTLTGIFLLLLALIAAAAAALFR